MHELVGLVVKHVVVRKQSMRELEKIPDYSAADFRSTSGPRFVSLVCMLAVSWLTFVVRR